MFWTLLNPLVRKYATAGYSVKLFSEVPPNSPLCVQTDTNSSAQMELFENCVVGMRITSYDTKSCCYWFF